MRVMIVVAYDGSGYSGNDASFSGGVLKLNNYTATDNSGGYTNKGASLGEENIVYYGIYADGDLIIELEGTNSLQLGLSKDITFQYGIYVKGNLTIRNASGKDGSLDLNLQGASGSGKAG